MRQMVLGLAEPFPNASNNLEIQKKAALTDKVNLTVEEDTGAKL